MNDILIVDDDKHCRDIFSIAVATYGYSATVVADASSAIRCLSADSFRLVITDLDMGGKDDGFRVIAAARQCVSPPRVCLVSGSVSPEDRKRAIDMVVEWIIEKPHVNFQKVLDAVFG